MQLLTKQFLPVSLIYNLQFLHGISKIVNSHFTCLSRTGHILMLLSEAHAWVIVMQIGPGVCLHRVEERSRTQSHPAQARSPGLARQGQGPQPRGWGIASERPLAPSTETRLEAVGSICTAFSLPFVHCAR